MNSQTPRTLAVEKKNELLCALTTALLLIKRIKSLLYSNRNSPCRENTRADKKEVYFRSLSRTKESVQRRQWNEGSG